MVAQTRSDGPKGPLRRNSQGGGAGGRTGTPPPAGVCQSTTRGTPYANQSAKNFPRLRELAGERILTSLRDDFPFHVRVQIADERVLAGLQIDRERLAGSAGFQRRAVGLGSVLDVDVVVDAVVPVVDHDRRRMARRDVDLV